MLDTTLYDQVCQWFSLGTLVSSTNKTDHHDITEILLKVVLKIVTPLNLDIFTLISQSDIVSIILVIQILKSVMSKHIISLSIKTIILGLNVSTYIITSTFKTAIILYLHRLLI